MDRNGDALLRKYLGPNLQAAALRAILLLAAFAFVGGLLAYIIR